MKLQWATDAREEAECRGSKPTTELALRYASPLGGFDPFWSVILHCSTCELDSSQPILLGLLTTMFAATGTLMNVSKRAQNDGKVCDYTTTSTFRHLEWYIFSLHVMGLMLGNK